MNDYEQSIIDNIEENGWFCVSVLAGEEPAFSYSVGFEATFDAPEFIVFGLPSNLTFSMLKGVFRQIKAGANQVADGTKWSGLLEGFDCISRPVHPDNVVRDYFNSAMWHWGDPTARGRPLRAFQLFWPGVVQGLFPWESGCAQEVRDLQPLLYLPPGVPLA